VACSLSQLIRVNLISLIPLAAFTTPLSRVHNLFLQLGNINYRLPSSVLSLFKSRYPPFLMAQTISYSLNIFYQITIVERKYLKIFALRVATHLLLYSFRIVVTPCGDCRLGTGLPSTLLAKASRLA